MIEQNKIYCENCLDTMAKMSKNDIDLCFADPDYNAKDIGPNHRQYISGNPNLPIKEYKKFCKSWFTEAKRISRRIVLTPGIAQINYYPQPYWIICWHKPAAVSFNRMGGYNAWEPICIYGKPAKGKRIGQDYVLFNTLNFKKGPEKEHPCPKVLNLIRWIILSFSDENDIIYDPFMGSGTTAVACIKEKRNYIGSEIEARYVEISEKRINIEIAQKKIEF